MNTAELFKAINDRAMSDSGAGGLTTLLSASTAFYYAAVPEAVLMPYCLVVFVGASDESAFSRNVAQVVFRVQCYVPRTSPSITDPIKRLSDIVGRVYGPGTPDPSYGFHRHQLVLTEWTGGHVVHQNTFDEHGDSEYCTVLEFKLFVSK